MPITIKRKSLKLQGNRHHGWGIRQHRKRGTKGGTGLTSGKFKHKRSFYMKMKKLGFPGPDGDKWRIGKDGFIRPQKIRRIEAVNAINLKDVDANLDNWVTDGHAEKKGDKYTVDLGVLNYRKLIGKGQFTKKVDITVEKASAHAVEKIKEAKGKVTQTAAEAEES